MTSRSGVSATMSARAPQIKAPRSRSSPRNLAGVRDAARSASSSGSFASLTALRTAEAMSTRAPPRVPRCAYDHARARCFAVAGRTPNSGGREPLEKAIRQSFGRERDQRAAGAGEIGEPVEVAQMGNSDMVRAMDAGPRGADERTFEVQAEHAVIAGRRARRRDGGLHLLPRIGDQRL